jgi:hypothetical protein
MPVEDDDLMTALEKSIRGRYAGDTGADNGNMRHGFSRLPCIRVAQSPEKTGLDATSVTVPESLIRLSRN